MTKVEKAQRIRALLDRVFPQPRLPLDHDDPYTLLVAVTLAARTEDSRVNAVTPGLFRRARTPEKMRRLTEQQILALIPGIFLAKRKAKALRGMAEMLCERHGGEVPRDLDALMELPGVGRKTAAMVLSQAFGVPAISVDTHVHRLAARWGLSDGKSVEKTERDLAKLYPKEAWARVPVQMILFGQQYCPARRHDFARCVICSWAVPRRKTAK